MSACEACWTDAYIKHRINPTKSQAEWYRELLAAPNHPAAGRTRLDEIDSVRAEKEQMIVLTHAQYDADVARYYEAGKQDERDSAEAGRRKIEVRAKDPRDRTDD